MPIHSKRKGARGEREWSQWLRERLGLSLCRRGQQFAGGPDSPDVVDGIADTHCEVKRVEKLNIHEAIAQAIGDAGSKVPYVAFRRNRGEWLVCLRAEDLVRLSEAVIASTDAQPVA